MYSFYYERVSELFQMILDHSAALNDMFLQKKEDLAMDLERYGELLDSFPPDHFVTGPMGGDQLMTAEYHIWKCCDALASFYNYTNKPLPTKNSKLIQVPWEDPNELIAVWQNQDSVIVGTPYLRRRNRGKNPMAGCATPFERLRYRLCSIKPELFSANEAYVYVMNVYRTGTNLYNILDPDNVNFKAVGDVVMEMLCIDDSGANISLICHTVFGDEIPPGSYTVVLPMSGQILSREALYNFVKKTITEPQNESNKKD